MAIRSSTSKNIANLSGAAITGDAPAGLAAGDRLLAWIVQDTAGTHSGPSGEGWTKIADANNVSPADGQVCTVWEKKVATGSETFAFTSSINKRAVIQIVALTGRHATSAAIVSTPTITNTLALTTPASIALTGLTANSGDDILWFGQMDQTVGADAYSFSALSGFTNLKNVANGDWISSAIFAKENVAAGATGTLTATATRTSGASNYSWSGVVVSIPMGVVVPTASIGDVTVDRQDGTATVPVTLSSPATVGGVTVNYATQDGTATAPAYYTAKTGTLTFAAGETTKNVTVSIVP